MTFLEKRNSDLNFKEKIKKIKALGMDIDGVLTDGKLFLLQDDEVRFFNTKDGFGIRLLTLSGIKTVIITGKSSLSIKKRCLQLGIDYLYENMKNKIIAMENFLQNENLSWDEVGFVGDDIPDIPLMEKVGFSAAPSDASDEVKKVSDFICKNKGGEGAIREVVELILKGQKRWEKTLKLFFQNPGF